MYNESESYNDGRMQNFFSEDGVSDLYEKFLADEDYEKNLKKRNSKCVKFKQQITNDEKNKDYSYQICRKNFHKIFNEKYKLNELELEFKE